MVKTKQKNATNKQKNNATKQKYNNKGKYYNDEFTWGMSAHFHPWFLLKLSSDTYELRQKNFESVDKKGSVWNCLKLEIVGIRSVLKTPYSSAQNQIWIHRQETVSDEVSKLSESARDGPTRIFGKYSHLEFDVVSDYTESGDGETYLQHETILI